MVNKMIKDSIFIKSALKIDEFYETSMIGKIINKASIALKEAYKFSYLKKMLETSYISESLAMKCIYKIMGMKIKIFSKLFSKMKNTFDNSSSINIFKFDEKVIKNSKVLKVVFNWIECDIK